MPVMHSMYREPGNVTIDVRTCTNCGQCAGICPAEILTMEEGCVRIHGNATFGCIACGHCMMVCPTGSVMVTGRGISPEDMVPLPPPGQRATADALADLMQSRRSVRRFSDREVSLDLLERIVAMAATGPMGIPPWDVGCVTVRGRKNVQELAAEIITGYEDFLKIFRPWLLAMLRPLMRRATYEKFRFFIRPLAEMYVESHRAGRDVLFWDAPAVMIFHHSPYTDAFDAAIASTYAMLAAESLRLGSTMIGGAAPMLQRNKALCKRLGMPPGNTPAIALILGHPAANFQRAVRRRFARVDTIC